MTIQIPLEATNMKQADVAQLHQPAFPIPSAATVFSSRPDAPQMRKANGANVPVKVFALPSAVFTSSGQSGDANMQQADGVRTRTASAAHSLQGNRNSRKQKPGSGRPLGSDKDSEMKGLGRPRAASVSVPPTKGDATKEDGAHDNSPAALPAVEVVVRAQSPKVLLAQSPKVLLAQSPKVLLAQSPKVVAEKGQVVSTTSIAVGLIFAFIVPASITATAAMLCGTYTVIWGMNQAIESVFGKKQEDRWGAVFVCKTAAITSATYGLYYGLLASATGPMGVVAMFVCFVAFKKLWELGETIAADLKRNNILNLGTIDKIIKKMVESAAAFTAYLSRALQTPAHPAPPERRRAASESPASVELTPLPA